MLPYSKIWFTSVGAENHQCTIPIYIDRELTTLRFQPVVTNGYNEIPPDVFFRRGESFEVWAFDSQDELMFKQVHNAKPKYKWSWSLSAWIHDRLKDSSMKQLYDSQDGVRIPTVNITNNKTGIVRQVRCFQ